MIPIRFFSIFNLFTNLLGGSFLEKNQTSTAEEED
jgi:hypothetical protein